ncbi:hypothetical protein Tco_0486347 [Tanacetum coccineum]
MSSPPPPHPIIILSDSDVEDTFSSTHSPDYIPASPDYFPASPGNTSPNFSDDLTKDLLASLALSPFYDDPYMKTLRTTVESPIPISPSSSVGSSSPIRSTIPPPDYPVDKSIFAELDNSLWIILHVTPRQGGNARRNEKGYHHNTMASI